MKPKVEKQDVDIDEVELDEELERPIPPEELEKIEEVGRVLTSKYGHPHQPFIISSLSNTQMIDGREEIGQPSVSSASSNIPHQVSGIGSERSTDSLVGLTLRYSGSNSSVNENESLTEPGEERLEDLLALEPSLTTALRINMTLQNNFRERLHALTRTLANNRVKQAKLQEEIEESQKVNMSAKLGTSRLNGSPKPPLRISYFSVPYFKCSSGMNAPMNDDAKKKVGSGYLNLYTMRTRTWMYSERLILIDAVHKEWKCCLQDKLKANLKAVLRKLKKMSEEPNKDVKERQILKEEERKYEEEMSELEKTAAKTLVPPKDAKLDWEKIAAQAFDGHRNSDECYMQWENFLHPSINHSMWTEKEDLLLQEMVMKNKNLDWEAVVKKLKTGRTAYLAMERWASFIAPALQPAKWTPENTQKLADTVNLLRNGIHIPWAQVQQHLVGFSRSQLQSRWRLINPDLSRGKFSVEEDFIMIKGLHMFGLNFTRISHFIPGRTALQVKVRYRRTLLSGFTHYPWTQEEDDILIENCKVGTKDWTRMMTDYLPRRTPCQIRGRYFVIQVWQTLSHTNMVPPPLFPVTMTVNKDIIAEIRKHMFLDSSEVKKLVDSSRLNINVKSAIQELENRRVVIRARKATLVREKLKKLTDMRGRRKHTYNKPQTSLPDTMLEEFFMPYRKNHSDYTQACEVIQPSLALLSQVMQLAVRAGVEPSEPSLVAPLHLTLDDLHLVKQLVTENKVLKAGESRKNRAYKIPLIPPNQTTVGAYSSFLHHNPKLVEMTFEDSSLKRATWNEMAKSTSQRKQTHEVEKVKRRTMCVDTAINRSTSSRQDSGCESQDDAQPGSSGVTQSSQPSCSTSRKIHVTSMVKGKRTAMKTTVGPCATTYSRGSTRTNSVGSSCKDTTTTTTTTSSTSHVSLDAHPPDQATMVTLDASGCASILTSEEPARQQADDLLFQRMTSIFFWPVLMSFAQPSSNYVEKVKKAENKKQAEEQQQQDKSQEQPKKPKCTMLTKDQLDFEEMEGYIEELAELDILHRNRLKHNSQRIKRKKKDQEEEEIEVEEEEEGKMSHKRKSWDRCQGKKGKMTTQPVSIPSKELSDTDPSPSSLPTSATSVSTASASEWSISSSPSSSIDQLMQPGEVPGGSTGLGIFRRKQNLKSLRRSLVMKKVWAGRKAGVLPDRTKTRNKRRYNPQASRTRNRVVQNQNNSSSNQTPAPWDLPLDGPLRVQPQVPLNIDFLEKQAKNVIRQSRHE
ncbi:hypothetical protein Pmani_018992 [Petrolisthes manimaculis]|uniref:snRNA-activating protein complex subunit 4 n=1 Tax=Petrolisthes manimaculis TaxID=1843537 RepID=A0AAE1PIL8_9EUCA|nr:hypothetical protein Pmani_018992 [Petrolisthes manimaculis]